MINKQLDNRMKRLVGQLNKIHDDIQNDKDCTEVVTQFMAVRGAVSGAFEEYVNQSLAACAKSDEAKRKKLISILIKA